jgi:hypothetical protein
LWVIDRNVVRLLIRSVSIPGKTTIFLQLKWTAQKWLSAHSNLH